MKNIRILFVDHHEDISTFPEDARDLPKLLAKADALMFDVKKKGKNAIGV